jgi:hypothetical protein
MGTKREWTDEEVRAEIAAAVAIVREDRDREHYKTLHEKYGESPSGDGGNPPSHGPPAPPKKEGEGEPNVDAGKKRGLWWGEALNEEDTK